jgi:Ran GTPase-activating protein (RanGAP) involved in mRNA processing and transport
MLQTISLGDNDIGVEGAKAIADAIKVNSILQRINLSYNGIGEDLTREIAETLYETRLTKEMIYRKFICAFIYYQVGLVRLPFDKMMLRFVYYPLLRVF